LVALGSQTSAGGVVYLRNANTGAAIRTINNPTLATGDRFGSHVAISGTKIVVTASADDTYGTNIGAIYVFDVNTGALLRTIPSPSPKAYGIQAMDFEGDTIVIGAYLDDIGSFTRAGRAYFINASTGVIEKTLDNPAPAIDAYFGGSVSIKNGQVAIGAYGQNRVYRGSCN
jgi:hypothetical protein